MPRTIRLDYEPQERQALLHSTYAKQILYGGAAGGGKSHCMRWDAVRFCLENPGLDAYLFRRTRPELENTHIKRIKQEIPEELGRYNEQKNRVEFTNGSFLNMCFAEHEKDVERYNSVEFHWCGVDEAGQFTPYQLGYLKSRLRLGGKKVKHHWALPRFVMSANPGGVSHHYLKSLFIDRAEPETIFFDETMRDPDNPDDPGWESIFIPAKIKDNKFLDKGYASHFGGLPDHMQRMLRDGDWNVVAGAFFDCWRTDVHVRKPFNIPEHWTKFRSIDWGHASPFSVGWWAVSDGEILPKGALVRYREWYGAKKDERTGLTLNRGLRMKAEDVALGIIKKTHERISYTVADPSMWRVDSGPSAAEKMIRSGVPLVKADNQRVAGWQEMYSRLNDDMLFVFSTCVDFVRVLPVLQTDDRDVEDVDTHQEDHGPDEGRYACMSRPFVKKVVKEEETRWMPTMKEMTDRHFSRVEGRSRIGV